MTTDLLGVIDCLRTKKCGTLLGEMNLTEGLPKLCSTATKADVTLK